MTRETLALTVTAYGKPVGQGAISYNASRHGFHTNNRTLAPWRAAVRDAAMRAAGTHPYIATILDAGGKQGACLACRTPRAEHGLLGGPLRLMIDVTVPALKSAPRRIWPITRSSHDWDHHARAIGDALSQAGVWTDDAQVVDGHLRKHYPGTGDGALDRPGAVICVWRLT